MTRYNKSIYTIHSKRGIMLRKKTKDRASQIIIAILGGLAAVLILYKIYLFKIMPPDNLAVNVNSLIQNIASTNITAPLGKKIVVDLSGEVRKPGVYRLAEGTRLVDLLKEAGGICEDANLVNVNLARVLADGQKIVIPAQAPHPVSDLKSPLPSKTAEPLTEKINLNAATQIELSKIPGIGPKYAALIVDFRENNGPIRTYDELLKIKGIGPKKIEKIKVSTEL